MCPNCESKNFGKLFLGLCVFLALGIFGLNAMAMEGHNHSHGNHAHHGKKSDRMSLETKVKDELIAVFKKNEALHVSFFDYKGEEVEKNAKEMRELILKISDKKIRKLLDFSATKLAEITKDKKRSMNDQNYHLVSMALIHVLNSYDLGKEYNAYSCPMVKKKWIQNSSKISKVHNPYAPNMKHCGSQDTKF